jgi:dolichol-phosphate mannosyltransferase
VEIAYLCQKYDFKVKEVPIHFNERVAGVSKMSPRIALEAAWKVWQIRFRY